MVQVRLCNLFAFGFACVQLGIALRTLLLCGMHTATYFGNAGHNERQDDLSIQECVADEAGSEKYVKNKHGKTDERIWHLCSNLESAHGHNKEGIEELIVESLSGHGCEVGDETYKRDG